MLNLEVTKELSALHYELHSINLKLNNLAIEQEVFSKSAKGFVEYELLKSKLNTLFGISSVFNNSML